jgi:hypothetical protein
MNDPRTSSLQDLLTFTATPGETLSGWKLQHNREVARYYRGVGSLNVKRTLGLLEAFSGFAFNQCGYSGPNVVEPLSDALSDALSLDIGNLDGGTISRIQHLILTDDGVW